MNVRDCDALRLLKLFARLEFALKQFPRFVSGNEGEVPYAQWSAFDSHIKNKIAPHTSAEDREVLLGSAGNPPPRKMEIGPSKKIIFVDIPLGGTTDDAKLMEAARRVRNNLVHGGKENKVQERYAGHDQRLVKAAANVMDAAIAADPDIADLCFMG